MDDRGDTDPNGHWIPITLHQLRLREDFRCIRIVYIVWTVVIHAHTEIMFEKQTKHGWSQTYLKASAVDREDDDTSSKLSPRPSASISGSAKFTAHAIPFSFVCTSLHTRRRFMYKVYLFAHPFSSSSLTEFSIQLNRSRFALTDWAVSMTHIFCLLHTAYLIRTTKYRELAYTIIVINTVRYCTDCSLTLSFSV